MMPRVANDDIAPPMGLSPWEYWHKAIADADAADWITVAAYGLAAWLSWRASTHVRTDAARIEQYFWQVSAAALIALGINELLDLQALLTGLAKAHAQANGWYEGRRQVQYIFVIALAVVAVAATALLTWWTRRMPNPIRWAMLGFASIGAFIVVRAASFHHIDDLLGSGWQAFNLGSIQEMAGIAIIGVSALVSAREAQKG